MLLPLSEVNKMANEREEDVAWPEGQLVKTAVVTGANSGIGKETAMQLAATEKFDLVILACRSKESANAAISDIRKQLPPTCATALQYWHIDLASLASVRDFVARLTSNQSLQLKVLVNNAGMAGSQFGTTDHKTEDGFGLTFGVNFLSHFLLTNLLLPSITAAAPSRIVNLSSVMHRWGAREISTYQAGLEENGDLTYADSKMAMVLFTTQLDKMIQGTGVEVHAVNPGAVNSNIWRSLPQPIRFLARLLFAVLFLTCKQGASTSVHAATAEGIGSNKYWTPYWIPFGWLAFAMEYIGIYVQYKEVSPTSTGRDPDLAQGLYKLCGKAVNLGPEAQGNREDGA